MRRSSDNWPSRSMASASAEELREQLSLLYGPVEVLSYGGRFFMVEKADL